MRFKDIDSVTMLLYFGIFISIATLVFVDLLIKDDSQIFQVIASVLTGFLGAFLGRVKPEGPPAGSTTVSDTKQITKVPPQEL